MTGPDPRITPARADLAAEKLRETVDAPRYAAPRPSILKFDRMALRARPDGDAAFDTVLLHGEPFDAYDVTDGWAWGQSGLDGYVGYLPAAALSAPPDRPATHAVDTLTAHYYREPKLKLPPAGVLPFGARIVVDGTRDGYAQLQDHAWVPLQQLRALDSPAPDWVAVAERFLGVPYVWGGRSSFGIDCSGLVQLALQAAGRDCPRDSDMQQAALGETLSEDAPLRRGDLIFWRGHVGILRDGATLLHANAHHMAVASEPLAGAIARIAKAEFGQITRRARLDATLIPD